VGRKAVFVSAKIKESKEKITIASDISEKISMMLCLFNFARTYSTTKSWNLKTEKAEGFYSADCPKSKKLQKEKHILTNFWNYVGLIRSRTHLRRAEKILRHLKNEIDIFYKGCRMTSDLLNLRSGAQTALLITYAALMNKNSLGAHYRED
jgi:aspartate oxidase